MIKKRDIVPTVIQDDLKVQMESLKNDILSILPNDMIIVHLDNKDKTIQTINKNPLPNPFNDWFKPGKPFDRAKYFPTSNNTTEQYFQIEISTDNIWHFYQLTQFSEQGDNNQIFTLLPGQFSKENASMIFKMTDALLHEKYEAIQKQQCIENNNSFTFAIMNSLRFGVIAVDLEGHILYANDTACVMVNIRRRDLLTIPMINLISQWHTIFETVSQGVKFQNEEVTITTTDSTIKYNINVSPINDLTGHLLGMVISLREIENLYEIVNKYTGMQARFTFDDITAKSKEMRQLVEYAQTIADSPSTVLIEGESGTGKEVFAQSIHNASSRREAGFVAINCAAIPDNLIESELFGYDDGAFTGAKKGGHPGKFELAHKGTLFLDEIGEMKADMQAKLLRAIQESTVMRIGGNKVVPVDVRIIAATNKNLKKEVEQGRFRLDLYYRLSVIPLKIPPLRNRKSDLPSLIKVLMQKKSLRLQKNIPQLHYSEFQQLLDYQWPGNIRELENFIEQLVNLDGKFVFDHFQQQISNQSESTPDETNTMVITNKFTPYSLDEIEKQHIRQTLLHSSNNMSQAAKLLGISRNTLYLKMKKYDLPIKNSLINHI